MDTLSNDLFYDILRRVDGATLASASCSCATFNTISKEERLWEDVCSSMWPSTKRDDVKTLISSTGGFKKFYADCFPLIVNKDVPEFPEEWMEDEYYGEEDELENVSPSDFVSLVDIRYKEKTICSKVIWGIPNANVYNGWFSDCPFRIDLFAYSDRDDDDDDDHNDHAGEVITLSVSDGLPPVTSLERERKDGKLWQELRDGIKLSWIIVNSKAKQAANLSSWCALDGQRHWPTNKDFLLQFGSIVPAKQILPCRVVKCIIAMKFRVTDVEGSGTHTTLNLTELCMQLGDMEGVHVNGRNSLLVLKEALRCDRSKNYSLVVESCRLYAKVQSEIREEKIRHENMLERLHILGSITAFVLLCCYFM
ncbi:probable F-box protein At2g36090 [Lactuca sativa]|uniref:probable F-box protein At2g36090 n=1 Tax=Lactuca sativa TaxID=4236 RepID=UPI000CB2DBEF|nr:probable F-box protein At2g36090 [Lactuca sativa]